MNFCDVSKMLNMFIWATIQKSCPKNFSKLGSVTENKVPYTI